MPPPPGCRKLPLSQYIHAYGDGAGPPAPPGLSLAGRAGGCGGVPAPVAVAASKKKKKLIK